MIGAVGVHEVEEAGPPPPGPGAPPTNGLEYTYGGNKIGLSWTNGDPAAQTQIGYAGSGEPTGVTDTVAAGATTYETGGMVSDGWWVRHLRNGQTSAWARVFTEE